MNDLERASKVDWIAYAKRGRSRKANTISPWWFKCASCGLRFVAAAYDKREGVCPACLLSRDIERPRKDRRSKGSSIDTPKRPLLGKPGTPDAPATCLKLAQNECPNYKDRACLGAALRSLPEVYGVRGPIAKPLPQCLLLLDLPCRFFDLSLLGNLPRYPGRLYAAELDFVGKTMGWQDRVAQFKRLPAKEREGQPAIQQAVEHPFLGRLPGEMLRKRADELKVCECGEPRDMGRTYCPACGRKHRKDATRDRVRAHRARANAERAVA